LVRAGGALKAVPHGKKCGLGNIYANHLILLPLFRFPMKGLYSGEHFSETNDLPDKRGEGKDVRSEKTELLTWITCLKARVLRGVMTCAGDGGRRRGIFFRGKIPPWTTSQGSSTCREKLWAGQEIRAKMGASRCQKGVCLIAGGNWDVAFCL